MNKIEKKYDIIHITNVHNWNDLRIFQKMARSLCEAGLSVGVVGVCREITQPEVRKVDGVTVHLVPCKQEIGRAYRSTVLAWRVIRCALALNTKLYQAHDPELIPFLLAARLKRSKLIFDAHEDFVGQLEGKTWAKGLNRFAINAYARLLRFIINTSFDKILTATHSIASYHPEKKSQVIHNYPVISDYKVTKGKKPLSKRPARGVFMGNLSEIRGIREIVEALEHTQHVEGIDIAGWFDDEAFKRKLENLPGWSKVSYHGLLTRTEVADILGHAKFGILTYYPLKNHLTSQPTKLFEYLSAGLPVLYSDFPVWHNIIQPNDLGVCADPKDPKSLAEGMDQLCATSIDDSLSKRAQNLVEDLYSWDSEKIVYCNFIRDMAST